MNIENLHQNKWKKWIETGVNVFDKTARNQLNEMGFTKRKTK